MNKRAVGLAFAVAVGVVIYLWWQKSKAQAQTSAPVNLQTATTNDLVVS